MLDLCTYMHYTIDNQKNIDNQTTPIPWKLHCAVCASRDNGKRKAEKAGRVKQTTLEEEFLPGPIPGKGFAER